MINNTFSVLGSRENAEDERSLLLKKCEVQPIATANTISKSHHKLAGQVSEEELKIRPIKWHEQYERGEQICMTKTHASVKVSARLEIVYQHKCFKPASTKVKPM